MTTGVLEKQDDEVLTKEELIARYAKLLMKWIVQWNHFENTRKN